MNDEQSEQDLDKNYIIHILYMNGTDLTVVDTKRVALFIQTEFDKFLMYRGPELLRQAPCWIICNDVGFGNYRICASDVSTIYTSQYDESEQEGGAKKFFWE